MELDFKGSLYFKDKEWLGELILNLFENPV